MNDNSKGLKLLDLKCETLEFKWDKRTFNRLEQTEFFLKKNNIENYTDVLSIGGKSEFDQRIADDFHLSIVWTTGDLDFDWQSDYELRKYKIIFMFEVIEHLKNPALFFERLKCYLKKDTKIFISYPRHPVFLKGMRHFHEMPLNTFYTLIVCSGYEIEDYMKKRLWSEWTAYLKGIRPVLRIFLNLFKLSSQNYFCLKFNG